MRRAMNRTVGDKTHESARYGSFLTVEWPSRKGFDRLGLILIRQALEGRLPLFTQSPRMSLLGNPALSCVAHRPRSTHIATQVSIAPLSAVLCNTIGQRILMRYIRQTCVYLRF